jgi:hypothetical protein
MSQLYAYLISLTSEAFVAGLLALTVWRTWPMTARAALAAACATALTHPIVWQSGLWLFPRIGYWPGLAVIEAFAVLAEWPAYMLIARTTPVAGLALSLSANIVSFMIGWVWLLLR